LPNLICVFSSPRSGSTWLAKILDSRPEVFYVHEPDIEDRGLDLLPFWFSGAPTAQEIDRARHYLSRLAALRTPRTMGTRPFFSKSYRPAGAEWCWRASVTAAKLAQNLGLGHGGGLRDFVAGPGPEITLLKMVSALGRVGRLIPSMPQMQPILIIRHPFGYAASRLRGYHGGLMDLPHDPAPLAATQSGRALGLCDEIVNGSNMIERLAWDWVIANTEASEAVQSHGGLIVSYDQLAKDPGEGVREIFERIGLPFSRETSRFLEKALNRSGRYYSVFRAAREQRYPGISAEYQAAIRSIVTRAPLGRQFFDSQMSLIQ
jgi:hypothetical protein